MEMQASRAIVTPDGYVSQGLAPHASVPADHATLQQFADFLENRLQTENMALLRRIMADFLNEHEQTMVAFVDLAATMIVIKPFDQRSASRRRRAAELLDMPKRALNDRGCIFFYLANRVHTRNMMLLKRMFLEFLWHGETLVKQFVEHGDAVISILPCAITRIDLPTRPVPGQHLETPSASNAAVTSYRSFMASAPPSAANISAGSQQHDGDASKGLERAQEQSPSKSPEKQTASNKRKRSPYENRRQVQAAEPESPQSASASVAKALFPPQRSCATGKRQVRVPRNFAEDQAEEMVVGVRPSQPPSTEFTAAGTNTVDQNDAPANHENTDNSNERGTAGDDEVSGVPSGDKPCKEL